MKFFITAEILQDLAEEAAERIVSIKPNECPIHIYGVPRGGVSAALAIGVCLPNCFKMVESPSLADVIVDDLIDSGKTCNEHKRFNRPFVALLDKREEKWRDMWVVFPWENTLEHSVDDNITRLIQFIGEDPKRGGLLETPARVARAWQHWCSGYGQDPASVLKAFEDGAENYNQMIAVRNLPFYSMCEHHMAPFFGTVTIAYIPNGKIVGLSKLSRLADIFARRLQVQERMTNEIASALQEHLQPIGVGVVVKARHLCMESRGIAKQGHETVTTALRGVFMEAEVRAEFLDQAR